jgi:hypothetical protein
MATIPPVLKRLVPDEGIEPPTFGLQNRCSTAELIRHSNDLAALSAALLPNLLPKLDRQRGNDASGRSLLLRSL